MIKRFKRIFSKLTRYFQQKRRASFRLLGWRATPNASVRLIIWIPATDKFLMNWTAQEVYDAPVLLAKFSAEDIKILVSLVCKNQMPTANKYRLAHTATALQNQVSIKLYAEDTQEWLITTLTEISENPQLAAALEGISAFELGQRYGEYQQRREQEMLRELRKTQYVVVKSPEKQTQDPRLSNR